ncbi:hypothetical protein GCM10009798_20760 [Nocardioides panacihumi]|uniref:YfhO family protein n=1 Tax=Nocardioides panacihumi TaxID=400774 RepID=A0ABP5CAJ3_9ACTN
MKRVLPLTWAAVLSVLMLGPALAPGFVLIRDMVWVPNLAMHRDVLGLGSALPRAVPSDAVVAILDEVVPGMLLQKLVLLGALVGAGTGAAALVRSGLVVRLVAVSVAIWSPFVVERLAIGHWPMLLGYAAVPWLAVAGRRVAAEQVVPVWTPFVLLAGSLSANAGLVSAAVLLVTGMAGGVRRRSTGLLMAMVVAANAPWLVAGLAHTTAAADAGGFRIFATAGHGLPAPLAVLTLGGIWNSDVAAGRGGVLGWAAAALVVGLAALGARDWWRAQGRRQGVALIVLWTLGVAIALLSWAAPQTLAAVGGAVPGLGLLRDGSRSLALAMPLTVGLVAAGAGVLAGLPRAPIARAALAVALVLAPVAVLPEASWGRGGELRAVHYPAEWLAATGEVGTTHGDALVLPWSAYRAPAWNNGRPVLDPLNRLLPVAVVSDGDLVVGATTVRGEDPRAAQAHAALALPSPQARADALRAIGIGWVLVEKDARGSAEPVAGRAVHDGPLLRVARLVGTVHEQPVARGRVIAQLLAWAAFLALLLVGVVISMRRAYSGVATWRAWAATLWPTGKRE